MTETSESVNPYSSDIPSVLLEPPPLNPDASPQENTQSSSIEFPFVVQEQMPIEVSGCEGSLPKHQI